MFLPDDLRPAAHAESPDAALTSAKRRRRFWIIITASLLLGRDVAITRVRGTWQQYRGTPLMPTLHPAFVLRQYTPENRRNVWEDLKAAVARAREA